MTRVELINLFHVSCFVLLLISNVTGSMETVKDYCSFESFKPECNNNQVVMMNTAVYGRMVIGRCVKRDYGHLGCKANVITYFDRHCSGRRTCEVNIPDGLLSQELTCLGELNPYLEASYTCQDIYVPANSLCDGTHYTTSTRTANYLSSLITQETLCGLHNTPYVISAKPGQKLKLTLIDFSWKSLPSDEVIQTRRSCAENYGYIVDTETNDYINICGGTQRRHELYVSSGSNVQVVLDSLSVQKHRFLVKYEAVGCPNISPPANAWVAKVNDTVTVQCHTSADKWRLTCVDNIWLGYIGNCSGDGLGIYKVEEQSDGSDVPVQIFSKNHVLAFTLGCVTLIVCCATVIVGFYCIKRYESRRTSDVPSLHYDDATIRSTMAFPSVHTSTLQSRAHGPMEYPACTLPMLRGHPPPVPQRNSSYSSSTMSRFQNRPTYFIPQNGNTHASLHCLSQLRSQQQSYPHQQNPFESDFFQTFQADSNCNFPKAETDNPLFSDVFDEVNQNIVSGHSQNNCLLPDSNVNNNPGAASSARRDPVHYFVLETPRESVSSDNEQLYQSIMYKSTDHIAA